MLLKSTFRAVKGLFRVYLVPGKFELKENREEK